MAEENANVDSVPVNALSSDLILHRAPDLKLRIHSDNRVRISLDDKTLTCGPHALSILDAFYQPMPFSEALKKLSILSVGMQDWTTLTSTILELYQAGVLRDETQSKPEVSYGFGSPSVHVPMLNDGTRTSSFFAGINELVAPGDDVVDIGTGTGVLAIAAARAGAKHVYAIEASSIARSAKEIFDANGLADRITLLRGWSTQITLPERADVLVSEIIGDDPLAEDVLRVTMDARKRLLKPAARLIPNNVKVFVLPVGIPHDERIKRIVTEENVRNWRSRYGIDFGPLIQVETNPLPTFYVKSQRANDWVILSEPVLVADVDLSTFKYPITLDNTLTVIANAAGQLDGLLMYLSWRLAQPPVCQRIQRKQAAITTGGARYGYSIWVLNRPLSLQHGDSLKVACKYHSGNYRIALTRA